MKNADHPRTHPESERLLWVDTETGVFRDGTLADLPDRLRSFDLLVVNDAATLPASLPVRLAETEGPLELRLAGHGRDAVTWWAVLFGPGGWRTPTEHRPPPPRVAVGDVLWLGPLTAIVLEVSPLSPRLLQLRFNTGSEDLIRELYHLGRPIQYSYLNHDVSLWDVQTRYGARPWSLEMPSAGRPITWNILSRLRRKGIALASLTHAAGLSATGDPVLDAALPLPERYELPAKTVQAIEKTREHHGRVIAVGTSVVRALEGNAAANGGALKAGAGIVGLVLGPNHGLRVVDGLLTGIHEPGTSHFALMEAFVPVLALSPRYATRIRTASCSTSSATRCCFSRARHGRVIVGRSDDASLEPSTPGASLEPRGRLALARARQSTGFPPPTMSFTASRKMRRNPGSSGVTFSP